MNTPKYSPEESLERIKLVMRYDMSKTATENGLYEQKENNKNSFFLQNQSSGKKTTPNQPNEKGSIHSIKPGMGETGDLGDINKVRYLNPKVDFDYVEDMNIWSNWNHETSGYVELGLTIGGFLLMATGVGAPIGGVMVAAGTAVGVADAMKYYQENNPYMVTMMLALQLIPGGELTSILSKQSPKFIKQYPNFVKILEKIAKNKPLTDPEGAIFEKGSKLFDKNLPKISKLIKYYSLRALSLSLRRKKSFFVLRYMVNLLRFVFGLTPQYIGKLIIKIGRISITIDQLWTLMTTPDSWRIKMRNKEEFSKIFDKLYDGTLTNEVKDGLWVVWQMIQGNEINETLNDEIIKKSIQIMDNNLEKELDMEFNKSDLNSNTIPNRWNRLKKTDSVVKSKKMIGEINRIHEIMGTLLLSEQKAAVEILTSIIDNLPKTFKNDANRLISKPDLKLSEVNKFLSDLKNKFPNNVELIKKINNSIISQSNNSGIVNKIPIWREKGLTNDQIRKKVIKVMRRTYGDLFDESIEKRFIDNFNRALSPPNPSKVNTLRNELKRFSSLLKSYFQKVQPISDKIIDLTNDLKYLQNELNKTDDISKMSDIHIKMDRILNELEFNLGIINRKERDKAVGDIKSLRSEKISKDFETLLDSFINGTNVKKTEGIISRYFSGGEELSWWKEIQKLRTERGNALKKVFGFSKSDDVKKLGYWSSVWKTFIGDIQEPITKLFKDPKLLPRIISTEFISRLFSFPFYLGVAETLYDGILWWTMDEKRRDDKWIKSHPNLSKFISKTGPDFKSWHGNIVADFGPNLIVNMYKRLGLTIPAYAATMWFSKYGNSGGLMDWVDEKMNKTKEIMNSNLSEEEKIKKLKEIQTETDNLISDLYSNFFGTPQTLESRINKVLSDANSENTSNITTSEINIEEDIKPVVPCLFMGGWDVSLVNVDGRETYVTHNSDWTEKYYLDVVKNNNTTTVYYKGTNKNPCG